MGKAVKPKVNPKLQRLKRMSIDELDRVSKQAAIKAVTKAAKAVKMNLVLKCTKRIRELKNGDDKEDVGSKSDDESDEEDSASASEDDNKQPISNRAIEIEVQKLHRFKSIDHITIGKHLAYDRYPKLFTHEISELKFKSTNSGSSSSSSGKHASTASDEQDVPIETIQLIKSHKKFSEALGKMDSEIILLQTQKEERARKQQNIINAQAVTKKPAKLGKAAAHNAIFLDSLQDESEDEDGNDDEDRSEVGSEEAEIQQRREKWKMERAARNQQNRAANKAKREQQQEQGGDGSANANNFTSGKKTDLSAYMPANQREKYRERVFGEKRPTKNAKQQGQGLNRAERRKLDREQGKSNNAESTTDTQAKKIIFEEDRESKRQRVETTNSTSSVQQSSDATSFPPRRDRNQVTPREPPRKDNRDLSQFAVEGKEWKESGVHPSWAAKQLSKPQIVEGQGKKITFD